MVRFGRAGRCGLAAALVLAAAAGCTQDVARRGHSAPSALPKKVSWSTAIRAIEPPHAAANGFVFAAFTNRAFEVVSIAAADGAVRWRAPASPSAMAPGVGFSTLTTSDGALTVWLEPGRHYRDAEVSVTAAETVTGKKRWSYGDGTLVVADWPYLCRNLDAICLTVHTGTRYRQLTLSVETGRELTGSGSNGRPVGRVVAPAVECQREISTLLCQTETGLAALTETGAVRWSRSYRQLFGTLSLSPDYGWDIELQDGRYIGALGRVRPPNTDVVDLADSWASFALDANTGATLWLRPGASVACGQVVFDPRTPVLCIFAGRATFTNTGADYQNLAVALEGIDPATGKATWHWDAGAVTGLVLPDEKRDVLRLTDSSYAVKTGSTAVELSLRTGPTTRAPARTGWCQFFAHDAIPAVQISGFDADVAYARWGWFFWSLDGKPSGDPDTVPDFAGDRSGRIYPWQDADGFVHGLEV